MEDYTIRCCTACLRAGREGWDRTVPGMQFHGEEKQGIKELCLTMSGLMEEHVYCGIAGKGHRNERAEGAILENKLQKIKRPLTCLQCESNTHCASASSWKNPIFFRTLDSTESRTDRCDTGATAQSRKQYSIKLQTKVLQTVSSSDFPMKDMDWQRSPCMQLAFEASFVLWFAQESVRCWYLILDGQGNKSMGSLMIIPKSCV